MMKIPAITQLDIAFGKIDHMPRYDDIPEEFKRMSSPYARAISDWFFSGAKPYAGGVSLDGKNFTAKEGVDAGKALAAIKAVLVSFEPKHEHKEAACAYMLSEWFDTDK